MAVIDEHTAAVEHPRYCPECGRLCSGERFCADCGHALDVPSSTSQATVEQPGIPPTPPYSPVSVGAPPGGARRRSTGVLLATAGALVLAVGAVAAIVLLSGSGSNQSGLNQGSAYRPKLSSALAPVVSTNLALSSALQSLDGSHAKTVAAQNATAQAKSAVVAARGAVSVLTVPSSDATLSQEVQQALTDENGYLQAVSSTLSNPAAQSASQLQTLVTATQSAFVPIAPVASGATTSLSGTDNLLSWVAGATGQARRQAQAAQRKQLQQATKPTTVPQQTAPPATPSSSPSGLTACDQNISVNSNTSCPFADNVFYGYAVDVQQAAGPGSYVVAGYSPSSGQSYNDTCNYNPANQIVLCSHGPDLIQFPYWAAEVYQTG
jgi:hypothetical protein